MPNTDRSKIQTIESLDRYVNDPDLSRNFAIISEEISNNFKTVRHVPQASEKNIQQVEFKEPGEATIICNDKLTSHSFSGIITECRNTKSNTKSPPGEIINYDGSSNNENIFSGTVTETKHTIEEDITW